MAISQENVARTAPLSSRRRVRYMMYGGEPAPNSAPAAPPPMPAGTAQAFDSWPVGCRPNTLRQPKNMVKAPSVSSTGVVGSVTSAYAPRQAPSMPNGSSSLISLQLACLRFNPPSTSEAVKSSASTSGTANCSGWESASSGTEIRADPNPVMPRMKYALIKMHKTNTTSATAFSSSLDQRRDLQV